MSSQIVAFEVVNGLTDQESVAELECEFISEYACGHAMRLFLISKCLPQVGYSEKYLRQSASQLPITTPSDPQAL